MKYKTKQCTKFLNKKRSTGNNLNHTTNNCTKNVKKQKYEADWCAFQSLRIKS